MQGTSFMESATGVAKTDFRRSCPCRTRPRIKRPYRIALSFPPSNPRQFSLRQNGCYVQHHGPPGRLPPRTRHPDMTLELRNHR